MDDSTNKLFLTNHQYSFNERIKDLFDFSSKRDYAQRSGKISGQLNHETVLQSIDGDKDKTFLEEGIKNLTELNLKL